MRLSDERLRLLKGEESGTDSGFLPNRIDCLFGGMTVGMINFFEFRLGDWLGVVNIDINSNEFLA